MGLKSSLRLASAFLSTAFLLPFLSSARAEGPLVLGLDHIPIVVTDLDKAQADFRAMGFAIKPGRLHADGIRNAHVKFLDGSEIELVTATNATDELTSEYLARMKTGGGPVYFGLYAPDLVAVAARLRDLRIAAQDDDGMFTFSPTNPLHPLFLGQRNKTSTDLPEDFAYRNGATRLSALWVRDDPALRKVLSDVGGSAHAHEPLPSSRNTGRNPRIASRRGSVSNSLPRDKRRSRPRRGAQALRG